MYSLATLMKYGFERRVFGGFNSIKVHLYNEYFFVL